jgi:NADH:ubiquinone oxidoreductase subunit 6 (subunit J)
MGIIIAIFLIILYVGATEAIFYTLGRYLFKLLRIKKYSLEGNSRKKQNIVELFGLVFFMLILIVLIIIKNKLPH